MSKVKKIIIVVVALSVIVMSMVLPSFAYSINENGSIVYDYRYTTASKVSVNVEGLPPTEEVHTVTFPEIDLSSFTNLTHYFVYLTFAGTSATLGTGQGYTLLIGHNYTDRAYEVTANQYGGLVGVEVTILNKKMNVKLTTFDTSGNVTPFYNYDKVLMEVQAIPLHTQLELDYKNIINRISSGDELSLINQIRDLESQISDRDALIEQKESEISFLESKNDALKSNVKNLKDEIDEKDNTITDLREANENNNALFSLFDGIGAGIANLFSPLLRVTIGQFTLLEILGFVITIGLVIFLVMLVSKLRS